MSKYQVILVKSAQKELRKLPKAKRGAVSKAFKELEKDPFLGKPLLGDLAGRFSVRVWPYRIIYRIEKNKLFVIVLNIGHRQGVYKR